MYKLNKHPVMRTFLSQCAHFTTQRDPMPKQPYNTPCNTHANDIKDPRFPSFLSKTQTSIQKQSPQHKHTQAELQHNLPLSQWWR